MSHHVPVLLPEGLPPPAGSPRPGAPSAGGVVSHCPASLGFWSSSSGVGSVCKAVGPFWVLDA